MTVKANKRTDAIGMFLLSGWTPWGVDLAWGAPGSIVQIGDRWIMCCGHVLRKDEVSRWVNAGLAVEGPPRTDGTPTLIAGPLLGRWVSDAFNGLQANRWGRT